MSSPAFPLESFYSWRSLRQSWARLVARLLYPACREEVLAELHRRSRLGGRVVSRCRCGGLEVECEAPPGLVTVCHCSVCRFPSPSPSSPISCHHLLLLRYDEAASLGLEDAPAPSFCAVPRASCRLVGLGLGNETGNIFTFRNSSDFARRGRCKVSFTTQTRPCSPHYTICLQLCSTALVMDYEWFEPNTVWLVRPVWQEVHIHI